MIPALFAKPAGLVLGTIYPAYSSYKAIKNKDAREYVKWMMYWTVFAAFTTLEMFADVVLGFWFPFYYEVKLVFLLWLISPVSRGSLGSSILYRNVVHPNLLKREEHIDRMLNRAQEQSYVAVVRLGRNALEYLTNLVMQTAISAPALMAAGLSANAGRDRVDAGGGGGGGQGDLVDGGVRRRFVAVEHQALQTSGPLDGRLAPTPMDVEEEEEEEEEQYESFGMADQEQEELGRSTGEFMEGGDAGGGGGVLVGFSSDESDGAMKPPPASSYQTSSTAEAVVAEEAEDKTLFAVPETKKGAGRGRRKKTSAAAAAATAASAVEFSSDSDAAPEAGTTRRTRKASGREARKELPAALDSEALQQEEEEEREREEGRRANKRGGGKAKRGGGRRKKAGGSEIAHHVRKSLSLSDLTVGADREEEEEEEVVVRRRQGRRRMAGMGGGLYSSAENFGRSSQQECAVQSDPFSFPGDHGGGGPPPIKEVLWRQPHSTAKRHHRHGRDDPGATRGPRRALDQGWSDWRPTGGRPVEDDLDNRHDLQEDRSHTLPRRRRKSSSSSSGATRLRRKRRESEDVVDP